MDREGEGESDVSSERAVSNWHRSVLAAVDLRHPNNKATKQVRYSDSSRC